jgi:hypothetical protein
MALSGYADFLSIQPGASLNLYVSTDAPKFRVEFYRLGVTLVGPLAGMPSPDIRDGQNVATAGCPDDWGWPAYAFTIPQNWQTGVYVAMLVEVDGSGVDIANQPLDRSTADGDDRKALFVVRQTSGAENTILFKVPTATYAAYNYTGGSSTYTGEKIASLRRPGLGTGGPTTFAKQGTPNHQVDVYDSSSDRMKVVHIEEPFIRWLENNGYTVDYCNDFDLHFDQTLLSPYQLLLSIGHDEYWSEDMRGAVTAMLQRGGNVAFFSGNTSWKYITFPLDWQLSNNGPWRDNNKPAEDIMTGVSYYWGNGCWDYMRQVIGYSFQITDHWILNGVGDAVLGDVYGDNGDAEGLIGYECDGTPSTSQNGILVPRGAPTPSDFLILGQASLVQLDGPWEDDGHGVNVCTMGLHTNGGVAFTVGTVDWGRVLNSGREPRVETLTRNVLNGLSIGEPAEWATFGGQITSTPTLGLNFDGRLELYARSYDGFARHVWQVAPNDVWANWASEGGSLAGDGNTETTLSMARNQDGRLQLFARFSDNSIQYLLQKAPNSSWALWVSLGGSVASDPVVVPNADGRLEVFVIGFDGALYHKWQKTPNGTWSDWFNQGGGLRDGLSIACNSDGRLEVFARGTDNAVWHVAQTAPNNGWSAWESLGGNITGNPCVGVNADGRLEVFACGDDNALWHTWQETPGGGWSAWSSENGQVASNLAVARNLDGRLEVFARGDDDALWRFPQSAPNNGWSGWSSLGGTFIGDPACGTNRDGRLEVFMRSPQRTLWHRWQTSPGNW